MTFESAITLTAECAILVDQALKVRLFWLLKVRSVAWIEVTKPNITFFLANKIGVAKGTAEQTALLNPKIRTLATRIHGMITPAKLSFQRIESQRGF